MAQLFIFKTRGGCFGFWDSLKLSLNSDEIGLPRGVGGMGRAGAEYASIFHMYSVHYM